MRSGEEEEIGDIDSAMDPLWSLIRGETGPIEFLSILLNPLYTAGALTGTEIDHNTSDVLDAFLLKIQHKIIKAFNNRVMGELKQHQKKVMEKAR
jgi:hypothetical protein